MFAVKSTRFGIPKLNQTKGGDSVFVQKCGCGVLLREEHKLATTQRREGVEGEMQNDEDWATGRECLPPFFASQIEGKTCRRDWA